MNNRVTIRDVADSAGVSISTVHQALNDKKGVSEETRLRIKQIADDMGYQPNTMASSLKRKTRHIAVLLPGETGTNRFYYPPVWKGVRDYLLSVSDMNIECTEIPYEDEREAATDALDKLIKINEKQNVDGLLAVGHCDALDTDKVRSLSQNGMKISLISSESKACDYISCVLADYHVMGKVLAELILSHIPEYGSILMCCGNPIWKAHSYIVRGFDEYLQEHDIHNRVYRDHTWNTSDESYKKIYDAIQNPDIAACCSVLSQSSIMMAKALRQSGKAGKIFAVGSDLSQDNVDNLKSGILNNIIQKNPYAQGYLGTKTLVEYLVLGKHPDNKIMYVGSEVVFRSTLAMYEHGDYRSLLL